MKRCLFLLLSFYAALANAQDIDGPLALEAAIQQAISNDPWLSGSYHRQEACLLYTSPSPRDLSTSRMPSSA